MSTDNKEIYVDKAVVDAVDAKIRESKALMNSEGNGEYGIMSSWARPLEGLKEGPQGKVTIPKPPEETKAQPMIYASHIERLHYKTVKIPVQAMGSFKKLLRLYEEIEELEDIEVILTNEQAYILLEYLESMPTPKMMADAQAIFKLMENLKK